jgi:hypothetical protein
VSRVGGVPFVQNVSASVYHIRATQKALLLTLRPDRSMVLTMDIPRLRDTLVFQGGEPNHAAGQSSYNTQFPDSRFILWQRTRPSREICFLPLRCGPGFSNRPWKPPLLGPLGRSRHVLCAVVSKLMRIFRQQSGTSCHNLIISCGR